MSIERSRNRCSSKMEQRIIWPYSQNAKVGNTMRQKRLKNSLLMVSAIALCIAVVAIAMTMFTENHSQAPTSYIHSVGIPVGETKHLEVEDNTLVGMTVNYKVIEREGGYGVVHNWNVGCPDGTAGFGDVCYPTISLIDFCGLYSPELKVTAKENELFDISCELDVHARAEHKRRYCCTSNNR